MRVLQKCGSAKANGWELGGFLGAGSDWGAEWRVGGWGRKSAPNG